MPGPDWLIPVALVMLFFLGMTSLAVYSVLLGGLASNNKYALLGGLRSAAQMISYEVPQGFALIVPLLMAGTMSLYPGASNSEYSWSTRAAVSSRIE